VSAAEQPSLEGLDRASCILDAIEGAAGCLAEYLSKSGESLDCVKAAFALGHLAVHARNVMGETQDALLKART
jgi:hypothetical protein